MGFKLCYEINGFFFGVLTSLVVWSVEGEKFKGIIFGIRVGSFRNLRVDEVRGRRECLVGDCGGVWVWDFESMVICDFK